MSNIHENLNVAKCFACNSQLFLIYYINLFDSFIPAGEGGDVFKDGGRDEERKTVQGMVGRHQGIVRRRNPRKKQEGEGS